MPRKSTRFLVSALVSAALVASPIAAQAGQAGYSGTGGSAGVHCPQGTSLGHPVTIRPVTTNINNTLNIYKSTSVQNNINVYKPTTINNDINVYKPVTINNNIDNSKNIDIYKPVTINKTIDNSKNIDITNNINASKTIEINKSITINKGGSATAIATASSSSTSDAVALALAAAISQLSVSLRSSAMANASATTGGGGSTIVSIESGATAIGGGSGGGFGEGGPLSVETAAPAPVVEASAPCSFTSATVIKAIHAICISVDGHEFPASHMVGDTWISAGYEGEIARCLPGSALKVMIGSVVQSAQGAAVNTVHGETLSCAPHEALRHFKDGMLKCAIAVRVPDCTERTNLRKFGTGDMFFSYVSKVCLDQGRELVGGESRESSYVSRDYGYSQDTLRGMSSGSY